MNNPPKILIVTPTADHKDYCLPQWSKSIAELTYPRLDILIIDNSKDKNHVKEFEKYEFRKNTFITHIERTEKHKDIRYLMCECNEIGRNIAIKSDYDFILSIESDVFAPRKDAVEILLSHRKEIVGFDYFIGQYEYSVPVVSNHVNPQQMLENTVQYTYQSGLEVHDGTLKRVHSLGLGFVLIARSVFTEVPFTINDKEWVIDTDNFAHADTFFYVETRRRNIQTWCDTRYMCSHRNSSWFKIYEDKKNKPK
jgi:hypothetical protein